MGRIHVTVAANGMGATARVAPGAIGSPGDLHATLRLAGVVHGIDVDASRRLAARLADPNATADAVVATGTPPVPGQDGRLDGVLPAAMQVGRTDERGNVDYRERDLLRSVAAGDVVATIVSPTAGTPGRDVCGRAVPARSGRVHRQRFGNGVRREGDRLIAAHAGVVIANERLVDVVPLYTHPGDVDYRSGNLHTTGSLLVQGDVSDGFSATADGDVVVAGVVQGGGVAAGGSVHVGRGILGSADTVRAGGDITCHHATSARLVAGGEIRVADQVTDSHLQALRVRVTDGHASVRGAEVHARDLIEVGTAGAPGGTRTVLAVGDLLQERAALARQTVAAARVDRAAGRGDRGRKGVRAAVRAGDAERRGELALRLRRREILRTAEIRVRGICCPGVVLRFGDAELRPTEELRGAHFRFDLDKEQIVREDR